MCEFGKRTEIDCYFCITAFARFAIYEFEFVSCELSDTLHCEIKDSSHIVLSPCLAFGSVVERVGLSHFIAKQFYCKCSPCLTRRINNDELEGDDFVCLDGVSVHDKCPSGGASEGLIIYYRYDNGWSKDTVKRRVEHSLNRSLNGLWATLRMENL